MGSFSLNLHRSVLLHVIVEGEGKGHVILTHFADKFENSLIELSKVSIVFDMESQKKASDHVFVLIFKQVVRNVLLWGNISFVIGFLVSTAAT
jgi:acetylglutamate synthase